MRGKYPQSHHLCEGEDDVEDTQAVMAHTRPRKRRIIAVNVNYNYLGIRMFLNHYAKSGY